MLTPAPGDTTAGTIGNLVRGLDSGPLTYIGHVGEDDAYHRGPEIGGTLIVVPGLWTTMPADLLAAIRARRKASATGRCPCCDAVLDLAAGQMRHENDCAVLDDAIRPLLAAWVRQVGQYARGRRIVEDPT